MASRSFRNTISVLSLAEGCAVVVRQAYVTRPRNNTVMALCDRVFTACRAAHALWQQGDLTITEAKQISRVMEETERAAFSGLGEKEDFRAYASLSLGLIADLLPKIKDPVKLCALDKLDNAMLALCVHFDRKLDDWPAYEKASRACSIWNERMMG